MTDRTDWKKRVFSHIRDDLNNKVYVWGLILLTLAAYGFTFAHVSYGIDDFGVRHYLDLSPENHGNMLQQGRLIHILFYFVGGLLDVIPFLNNFLSAVLMTVSAVLFNGLFAATALLVTACLDKQKVLRILSSAVAVIVLVLQLKDVNLWFYKDWTNHQKNAHAIDCIATDLYADYSVDSKLICFVNRDYSSFLMSWDESIMQTEIGESPIVSSIRFLGTSPPTRPSNCLNIKPTTN